MKIINYFGDEQKIYYDKMPNGLEIYVLPNHNQNNYHFELVTRYGSNIKEFIPLLEKEYIKLPLGVAHFLEHKMFDSEDGDVFEFYSKTGTYVNAGTNFFSTKYYVDGKRNMKKNLDYLLNFVYTPYFKEENVNNEKGIIDEEIKMYEDEANWILDYETKKSLFFTNVCEQIAGTSETIKEINADILTKTYNTFYQPSNMFLVATGNVDYKDIVNIINNNAAINMRVTNYPIISKKEKEKVIVPREYHMVNANIVVTKLSYSFKFDLDKLGNNYLMTKLYLNLLFTHLFSSTSKFNEKVLQEKIASDFYLDHLSFDNIYTFTIEAESEYADVFKNEVDNALNNIDISEDDLERIKKIWISVIIRSLDNKEALAYSVVDDIIKDGEIYDQEKIINMINYNDLQKMISKLDLSNKSFVLMLPKANK